MSKFIVGGREYPITLSEVTMREGKLLEQVTDLRFAQLRADLIDRNPDGMAAFLWLAMRKNDRHIPFDEVLDLPMGSIRFEVEEPDPTQASPATPTAASTSPVSTPSPTGPPSPPKPKPTSPTA